MAYSNGNHQMIYFYQGPETQDSHPMNDTVKRNNSPTLPDEHTALGTHGIPPEPPAPSRMAQQQTLLAGVERERLETAQQRYLYYQQILANHTTEIISCHAPNGSCTYVSPSCYYVLGYEPEALYGKQFFTLFEPGELARIKQWSAALLRLLPEYTFYYRMRHYDGHTLLMEITCKTIRDAATEHIVEIVSISRDVTRQRHLEKRLEHSQTLLQTTIDAVSDGIVVIANNGRLLCCNHAFRSLWGLPDQWSDITNAAKRLAWMVKQVKNPAVFVRRSREMNALPDADGYDIIALKDERLLEQHTTPYRVGERVVGRIWRFRDVTEREHDVAELHKSRANLKAIFDNATIGIFLLTVNGRYSKMNDHWPIMLGYTRREMSHHTLLSLTYSEDVQESHEYFEALLRGELVSYRLEHRFVRKDGSFFWGDLSVRVTYNQYDALETIIGIVTDITERKQAEESLRQAHNKLQRWADELEQRNREATILNEMSDLLQSCRSVEETYEVIQQAASDLFEGKSGALYLINEASSLLEMVLHWGRVPLAPCTVDPKTCWALRRRWAYVVGGGRMSPQCQTLLAHNALDEDSLPYICVPLIGSETSIGVLNVRIGGCSKKELERWERLSETVARNIALALANLTLREQLHNQSIRDQLTGLYNRRYLDEALQREIERARRQSYFVGIVMLDVDHFKQYNDTYGHDGGDALLRLLGAFLNMNVRGDDIACRYGGEEFTLILLGASLDDTSKRAEDLRQAANTLEVEHNGITLGTITISLGVACFPTHGATAQAVVRAADQALYRAKAAGRNRTMVAERVEVKH